MAFGALIDWIGTAGSSVSDFLGPTLTTGLEGAAVGAGVGALGSKLAGGNAGTGALIGGGLGGAGGLLSAGLSGGGPSGGGGSASASAAPPSVPVDQTGGFGSTVTPGGPSIAADTFSNVPPTATTSGSDPSSFFGGVSEFLNSNPWVGKIGVPAAGLAYEAFSQPKLSSIPGYGALQDQAGKLSAQGSLLESYIQNGTLPPGVKTSLDQASAQAKAAIRSEYAARGESGSSAEATDLANVDNTMASQGASIALNLLNSGVTESNLSATLYGQLMNTALSQDQLLSQAIGTLAGAAARPTINVTQAA